MFSFVWADCANAFKAEIIELLLKLLPLVQHCINPYLYVTWTVDMPRFNMVPIISGDSVYCSHQ